MENKRVYLISKKKKKKGISYSGILFKDPTVGPGQDD